jgi:hypothetical protein
VLQYCEPLRHPIRPGLSLASCQLISTAITAGASRVASGLLCVHAVAITPAGSMELVRSSVSIASGLPRNSKVGSCNYFFEACSAFTRVTACTLAESPSDPLHRKLRQIRCLGCGFDCYRVERTSSRAGVAPAGVQRLSRRTVTSTTPGLDTSWGSWLRRSLVQISLETDSIESWLDFRIRHK